MWRKYGESITSFFIRTFVATLIFFGLSISAFADADTTKLDKLAKKMVVQSGNIRSEFDKHKMNTSEGIYGSIWREEYEVIDSINIAVNTAEILKTVNEKNKRYKLVAFRAYDNIQIIVGRNCMENATSLNLDGNEIKISSVKNEVAKQADYAKQACDALDILGKDISSKAN